MLANEEVKDGKYIETGDPVERRLMKQWMLRITEYAERLAQDLDGLDWPEPVKKMQRDWIGRSTAPRSGSASHGREDLSFTVFTTRPDTLFGGTYFVLAPEHPLVEKITTPSQARGGRGVRAARGEAERARPRRRRRQGEDRRVTGRDAVNPVNGARTSRSGSPTTCSRATAPARCSVPGHDERD